MRQYSLKKIAVGFEIAMDSPESFESFSDVADNFGYSTCFYHLLTTKLNVDVTFIIGTEDGEVEVYAHQLILAMRSPYFADLFYGKEKGRKVQENQVIHLKNINAKAFDDMIRLCYDCKPGLETLQELCVLFRMANQFKVMSLMNLCRTRLSEMEIETENVFDILEAAELMEDKILIDACYKFLEESTARVIESYEMARISSSMVRVILDLPKLSLNSEFELIKWIFDCANAKVEEKVCGSAKDYLKDFLPKMNFLALDFKKFATLCKDYPDSFTSEEIACIYLNIAHPGITEMPEWHGKDMKAREYISQEIRSELINNDISDIVKYVTYCKSYVLCYTARVMESCEMARVTSPMVQITLAFILIACIYQNIAHPGITELLGWHSKDMKAELINNDISDIERCVTYIENIEEMLGFWKKNINCLAERIEYLENQDSDEAELFLVWYVSCKHKAVLHEINVKLLQKEGILNESYPMSIFKDSEQIFEKMFILAELGISPDFFKGIDAILIAKNEIFENMKKEHANKNRAKRFHLLLERSEVYQGMKKLFHMVEENVLKIFDDLYEMYTFFAESENNNEMLNEKFGKLKDDYFALLKQKEQINDISTGNIWTACT